MKYKHLLHLTNRTEAQRICDSKYNGSLPDITNYNDHMNLKVYMMKNRIQQSWLGIYKQEYNTSRWVNSIHVGKDNKY